ncbi:MAG: hypothetical protein V1861_00130 [Candidatus Micrarchaeota archaeon]
MSKRMALWKVSTMKGQLSAEMLILIVVVLAVVAIAATQMMGTAKETQKGIGEQTKRISQMAAESVKSEEGDYCTESTDCREGLSCEAYRCA